MSATPTFELVPRDLQGIPRWLVWRFDERTDKDGNRVLVKVPQSRNGNCNAHDPANWLPFDKAVATLGRILANKRWKHGGGIGFVFVEDDDIGGVDLDGCRDPATGAIAVWANRVLELFKPAYVELSPSGKGFHILARGAPKRLDRTQRAVEIDGELHVEGKDPGIEAYVTKRFFTITGEHVTGRMDALQVRTEAWVQVDAWLRGDEARHERAAAGEPASDADIERVRSALAAFGSDDLDRNGWIGIGMALKGEFAEDGKALWLEWMAKSPHNDADDNERTWKGLPDKPLKVGLGTVFYHAKQHGWSEPRQRRGGGSKAPTAVLVDIIEQKAELWHDQRDLPYATVSVERSDRSVHHENLAVDSGSFSKWLEREFYLATGGTPKREHLKEAISLAGARAGFDGPQHDSWIRVAAHDGRLYLDVGDKDWQAIEIDQTGWRVVSEPPVKFRRAGGDQALPIPVRGNPTVAIEQLGELIRPRRMDHLKLLVGWMVACLRPGYPIPILVLACEHGSAKSSALRAIRSHIDPRVLDTPGLPGTEKDVIVSAHQQWLFAADNITTISPAMSDILCRVVTGGGFSGRALYTNEEVSNIVVKRPVALTAIGTPTMRADFVDRSITLKLRMIEPGEYLPESEVAERLHLLQPLLMGALLDGASAALRRLDEMKQVHAGRLPRMADFALWAEAAGEAFGWQPGEFLDVYLSMLNERMGETAADDPLCALILDLLCEKRDDFIEGPAGEILERLKIWADRGRDFEPGGGRRSVIYEPWWPQRPRGLSSRLEADRRLLDAIGVTYTARPHPHSRTRGQIHRLELNDKGMVEKDERFRGLLGYEALTG